ncbi:MAG: EMC3/TMCO1 family protein [Nitrososphaeraceae archaeon]
MTLLNSIIMQIPGLAPHYTTHPLFHDMFQGMIVAALIAVGLNFAMAMLRKKTTDIEKMNKVMKETNEWRKQYTDAIKKHDKVRIEELKKKQAYVNKMTMEMQQQQMRPMLIYMMPSFMLWIFVFPTIFGAIAAISPIHIPYIMCDTNVKKINDPCAVPGGQVGINKVYLFGWFLITSFAFSGIISKVTKTGMPSIT